MASNEENKAEHLSLIHSTIGRMSTNSALFKGFTALVVLKLPDISFNENHEWGLFLFLIPVVAFTALDIYYLRLERKFRYLYDKVRKNEKPSNYSLALPTKRKEVFLARSGICECVKSPSIYLFYVPCLIVSVAFVILKVTCCL